MTVQPTVGANDIKIDDITSVVFLQGHGRLPADLGGELVDVLGDVCRTVVCDLSGMAAAGVSSILDAFAPASYYLRIWPGTALVVYAPEEPIREALVEALVGERIVIPASMAAGEAQALAGLPRLQSVSVLLPPSPRSASQARRVVRRALAEWELGNLDDTAALVTTELVSNAVLHAQTLLHLTLVRAGDQLRLAVRDRGGGYAASDPDLPYASSLHGRGLALVESFTRGWGVLPARRLGKTVWAVLENGHDSVLGPEAVVR
jgi:anti-sigma regulatory factor (Ser/Thr protein kinase)